VKQINRCLLDVVQLDKYVEQEEKQGCTVIKHSRIYVEVFKSGLLVGCAHAYVKNLKGYCAICGNKP
jgi:hypothetical protein